MRTVSVSELKARLSEQLRYVRGGQRVIVLDRGTPVAILAPLDADDHEGAMTALIEEGLIRPPVGAAPEGFFNRSLPPDPNARIRRALDEERAEGW